MALAEAGLRPCRGHLLADPLQAMQRFAADTGCTVRVPSADGANVDRDRHAAAHPPRRSKPIVSHTLMPPWAPQACDRLRQVLDRLEDGAGGVAKTLDWAIKLSLYREFARRQGICRESLPAWNRVLQGVEHVPLARGTNLPPCRWTRSCSTRTVRSGTNLGRLTRVLQEEGLALDELKAVLALRRRLFELDTRFAQLGPQGLFAVWTRPARWTTPCRASITSSMPWPIRPRSAAPACGASACGGFTPRPATTVAIGRAYGTFAITATSTFPTPSRPRRNGPSARQPECPGNCASAPPCVNRRISSARLPSRPWPVPARCMIKGDTRRRIGRWSKSARLREFFDADGRRDFVRLSAWVQTRRGFLDGPAILAELSPSQEPLPLWLITDYAFVFRFCGLDSQPGTRRLAPQRRGPLEAGAGRKPPIRRLPSGNTRDTPC